MSLKAPCVPGGTKDNVEDRFELFEKQEDQVENFNGVTVIESLCVNCHENGETRLMLTMIPYFREVIVMSFECESCGFKNSEVQFGGKVQEKGCRLTLHVETKEDLNRQVIKSDSGIIRLPKLAFEIPAKTQRGSINTIEGLLQKAVGDLRANQEERRGIDPETTAKIDSVLSDLALMAAGITLPFTIELEDVAGNSYIENPYAPEADPNMTIEHFVRSEAQDLECGLQPDQSHPVPSTEPKPLAPPRNEGLDALLADDDHFAKKEVLQFPTNCHACNAPGNTCMCVTDIPHFKEVIIMAFNCEACGFRTNEVKGGGAVPPQGERITLHVAEDSPDMLDRDILKADSAYVSIPEIGLEMSPGSLGGIYTTVEGLLDKIKTNIEEGNPFAVGDSDGGRSKLRDWLQKLDTLRRGKPFTLVLADPLANSFIYSPYGKAEDDPRMESTLYDRTDEENEELGLNDINVDEYSTETISSDKKTMSGGGQAIRPADYHPNPRAVMDLTDDKP